MRLAASLGLVALAAAFAAACGSTTAAPQQRQRPVAARQLAAHRPPAKPATCAAGTQKRIGNDRIAYAAVVRGKHASAYQRPGGQPFASFGHLNVNGYPTVFGIRAAVVAHDCRALWYLAELPMRPNGTTGYVRAADVHLGFVTTRLVIDLSEHRVTLYRNGRQFLHATAAVGSPATPTPIGRFYVDQRLLSADPRGPYGPAAIGVSAFSNVLTGWAQGGPIGIHGTNEPWSIGHSVSNGCIRLDNHVISRLFAATPAGTPVVIRP